MRVYISADMEGASGVVHAAQTAPDAPEYARACELMIGDVNAAIEGALAGGATYVLVNDSHWNMRNLRLEQLHPAAELISGTPKPFSMVQGLDASFDAAFFVGYHGMAGSSPATIDHTYTEDSIYRVTIGGRVVGELGINALFAGHHGVPVTLVTGDQTLAAEARALLGEVVAVEVKEAYSRSAARCLPLEESRRRIHEGARQALASRGQPLRPEPPVTLLVEFMKSSQADMAALLPGSERVGPRAVQYSHVSYIEIYRAWRVMYNLAG
ncbi:MAG TPA: M55 family metallopeptidase [Roseiflexaceae bacterium]|nr:M55 family metallopeptidase [Roseiflexaceae bacterium]